MYPSTEKMANPERKLVMQFTVLVKIASLQRRKERQVTHVVLDSRVRHEGQHARVGTLVARPRLRFVFTCAQCLLFRRHQLVRAAALRPLGVGRGFVTTKGIMRIPPATVTFHTHLHTGHEARGLTGLLKAHDVCFCLDAEPDRVQRRRSPGRTNTHSAKSYL